MIFISAVRNSFVSIEELIISWTEYSRLCKATELRDYEQALSHIMREVKFNCETLLAILFFLGTGLDNASLISWTLACLLYSLITYFAFDAMSGESLHSRLDGILVGRVLFACLAKIPALSVIATLCALATTRWSSKTTCVVMFLMFSAVFLTLAIRLRCHLLFCYIWKLFAIIFSGLKTKVVPHATMKSGGAQQTQPTEGV